MMLFDGLRSVETHMKKNMLLSRPAVALAPQLKRKSHPPQRLQTGNVAQT